MIVFIPAKGRSERIPRKNLSLLVGDCSLLEWCVRNWRRILPGAPIVVATDDPDIEHLSHGLGCSVYPSGDDSRTATDLFIEFCGSLGPAAHRHILLTQCTSPFTFSEDVNAAIERPGLLVRSACSRICHTQATGHTPSQHITPTKTFTGNFILLRGDAAKVTDWLDPECGSAVNEIAAIDINTPADLQIARWVASRCKLADLSQVWLE